jgi:hypothetical protein
MDQKRKTAIIVRISICALALTLMVSLVTGAVRVSILMDTPFNILALMVACLAASMALALGILYYLEKSKSCQNISCTYHPHYNDDGGSLFKEMTGVLNVSELRAVGLIVDEHDTQKSDAAPVESTIQPAVLSADKKVPASVQAPVQSGEIELPKKAPEQISSVSAQATAQTNRDDTSTISVGKPAEELVPPITYEEIFGTSIEAVLIDEIGDVEEPHEKPSMDFTDNMIPVIITAVYNTKLEAAIAANRANAPKELSGESTAIEWLFNEQPENNTGRHFKSEAPTTQGKRSGKRATVTRIDSVA